jgi:hypothetical protein
MIVRLARTPASVITRRAKRSAVPIECRWHDRPVRLTLDGSLDCFIQALKAEMWT